MTSLPTTPPPERPARWSRRAWQLLAIAGLVLPWYFNLRYLGGGGSLLPQAFLAAVGANALTSAITWDVYLAALSFCVWVLAERRVRRPWLYVLLCLGVALSLALPLYLLQRQRSALSQPGRPRPMG